MRSAFVMSGVFNSKVFVAFDTASVAVKVHKLMRFEQRVALGEDDPIFCSVQAHECVLVHVIIGFSG